MRAELGILAGLLLLPMLSFSQDASEGVSVKPLRYSPPSRNFYCDLPVGWHAFEEAEGDGPVVRLMGPQDPRAVYQAGIDIRWNERGEASYKPYKVALEEMRRGDEASSRAASAVHVMRISGVLARVFEITETRRLPLDRWPSMPVELHRYMAIYPVGESYFTISLASTRDSYLDYKDVFLEFLKGFKPMGFK